MDPNMEVRENCGTVRLTASVLPAINYAMQQNGAVAVQSVTIENMTGQTMENVELEITSAPEFLLPFTRRIEQLPAGKPVVISRPKLILNGEFLAGMTEQVAGLVKFTVKSGDRIIAEERVETRALAFDQWHGIGLYPELLASFVTPNHPALGRIIARATEFLGQWTGDTSMDAYQSQDPNRVLSQAAAIFTALKEQGVAYTVAPASFEGAGQRVRLCDGVLNQKLGNCLDLTLLYAGCLEAVGLHPLLIVMQGHIFTGVWLEDRMFPECIQDDISLITKRLASGVNEIAVVETTAATTGRDLSFDHARSMGEQNLTQQKLECIIDVQRARMSRIIPLPQRVMTDAGWEIVHDVSFNEDHMTAPTALDDTIQVDTEHQEPELPKKVQWERKLLDLGMRNNLINLRMTRTQIPLLAGALDALEDALNDGSDFTILPKPADWHMDSPTFDALAELGAAGLVKAEFVNRRLRSVYTEGELSRIIKDLYRTARTALEENGANTLYLALGVLRWYESKRSTKARYAPIILIPIEMVKKSAVQGYVIRLRDEEPQMNITLLEKLKQDFGIHINGLDPLPADDHGVDIRKVLTVMRKAVMEQPRWDVLETASIGIFSFSQFVMWNDIRNRTDDLMRNKVVHSLMDGKLCWDAKPLEMGERVEEDDVLLPMAADASQLYAIRTACDGESFVLHGPPGTGKSQTITSLIANALAKGKSVLFVAEKMAALSVVQKRLESIGIGPFCLELHSNKSRKKDVLEQLRRASEVTRDQSPEEFLLRAEQLAAMREQLDGYARQLHRKLPCGSDLYTLINEYEHYADAPELEAFDRDFLLGLSRVDLEDRQAAVERLVAAGREVGHPFGHPLTRVTSTKYTQTLRTSLKAVTEQYMAALDKMTAHVERFAAAMGEKTPESAQDLWEMSEKAAPMACWYEMPSAWTGAEFPALYFEEVEKMARHFVRSGEQKQLLLETFEEGVLDLDGGALFEEYTQVAAKWALPKMMGVNKLTKTLGTYEKKPLDKAQLPDYIALLRDFQRERKAAGELFDKYGRDLEAHYRGEETDWSRIFHLAGDARASAQAIHDLYGSYDVLRTHCGSPELRDVVMGLTEEMDEFAAAKKAFDDLLGIMPQTEEGWLAGQMLLCRNVLNNAESMKEWMAYVAAAEDVRALGLGNVAACYEQGADHDAVYPAYRRTVLRCLIEAAIEENDAINQFSGALFNKKIDQYKRMDQEWTRLSRQEVYCRLAAKVPNFTREGAQSSELGILQRYIKSGGRGISIRRMFDQIPNLLPRLCPCMLMSPISAAQYLDPKREPFDIVVFDEASQLPTCKAVGVLARGRDAVIVGDPKQMPPTAFFATNAVDEDNLELEDLESILDDCLALNMPQSHLLWHYRSRHESLIAFSNSQFYENKLLTFPSVNDRESKVRVVHIDGQFDRGRSRTNKAEAQAVVEEIRRRFRDPALSGQSLGVVTFNISQQNLIDDLLTEACARDPALEKWAYGSEEPLFIKNLENVQGDERDVILFSIGFGPDENGKVSMNFGPLNREGGWRRLNVAVTRARCEMMVFSTLRSEQLDLNRTKAEGVAALKSFLEYAEGKLLALGEVESRDRETCRGVAEAICKALREHGYEADLAVGRSEYRIDIGVVDPEQPDTYLLGILLDGYSYGNAKTTRDREIAQSGVLKGLGWRVLRVWTMDWWDNRDKELKRILKKIKEIRSGAAEPEVAAPAPRAARPVKIAPEAKAAPTYRAATLMGITVSPEEFVDPKYAHQVRSLLEHVVEQEAPISQSLLIKRVVQSCGITRAGSRIQGCLNGTLSGMELTATRQADALFYWSREQVPEEYIGFRASGSGENRRDVRDVPVQEVANAVYAVLNEQVSMGQEDLLRETANKLGYTRLGSNVLSALELGIEYARDRGGIALGGKGAYVLTDAGAARAKAAMENA